MNGVVRIAVVRALHGLGDMLCAVPAIRALRAAHPAARIELIGLPSCRWMLDRFDGLLDTLVPFPGFPGIPEWPQSAKGLERFVTATRAQPFDLAIQMHGSGRFSNAFTSMLGAHETAGFYDSARTDRGGPAFFPYPDQGSEVHRCLYLTAALECPSDDDRLAFPVIDADRDQLRRNAELALLGGPFVCIHAGARDAARRWPPERFAAVGDALAARGFRIVLTGTSTERETADAVAAAMRAQPINAAGETTLGGLAALLERASLLVSNDTGVSHLAAALRTPSVVVFLASDPDRWAPLDLDRHRALVARRLDALGVHRSRLAGMRVCRGEAPETNEVLDEASGLLDGVYGG